MQITLELPANVCLLRLCRALRLIGLKLSYGGDGIYRLREEPRP